MTEIKQVEIQKGKNLIVTTLRPWSRCKNSNMFRTHHRKMDTEIIGIESSSFQQFVRERESESYYVRPESEESVGRRFSPTTDILTSFLGPFIQFREILFWSKEAIERSVRRSYYLVSAISLAYASIKGTEYLHELKMEVEIRRLRKENVVSKHSTFTQTFTIPV